MSTKQNASKGGYEIGRARRSASSAKFLTKKTGSGGAFAAVSKRGSITQSQANSAVESYRSGSDYKK